MVGADHAVDAEDPIEWAVFCYSVDGPGNSLSLLVAEVREEIATNPPSAATIVQRIRELHENGLLVVRDGDDRERIVDDGFWQKILDEYDNGVRKQQDLKMQDLDVDDVWVKPTDAGRRRAVQIGGMIDHKGLYS